MKIIDQIIANTIQIRNVISTDVPKPTFNGHSNKKDQTVFVKLALSNFDAAATIIHESMHLQPHAGLSRKEEEDLIRTTVSQLRSNMGNALKLTDPEKAQSALPSVSLTKKQREAVVAKSEHYNPTKTHIANNEYKITIFVPRVVRETLFSGFIPVP